MHVKGFFDLFLPACQATIATGFPGYANPTLPLSSAGVNR
jgi:hypothetical protein